MYNRDHDVLLVYQGSPLLFWIGNFLHLRASDTGITMWRKETLGPQETTCYCSESVVTFPSQSNLAVYIVVPGHLMCQIYICFVAFVVLFDILISNFLLKLLKLRWSFKCIVWYFSYSNSILCGLKFTKWKEWNFWCKAKIVDLLVLKCSQSKDPVIEVFHSVKWCWTKCKLWSFVLNEYMLSLKKKWLKNCIK